MFMNIFDLLLHIKYWIDIHIFWNTECNICLIFLPFLKYERIIQEASPVCKISWCCKIFLLCMRLQPGHVNYPSPWYWIRNTWKIYCLRTPKNFLNPKIVTSWFDKRKNRQNTERYICCIYEWKAMSSMYNHFQRSYVISCIFEF